MIHQPSTKESIANDTSEKHLTSKLKNKERRKLSIIILIKRLEIMNILTP